MDKRQRKEMIQKHDEALRKKHLYWQRFWGVIATILNLFFAFIGGKLFALHVGYLFLPTHVVSTECPYIVSGILLIVCGLLGAYGALYFVFQKTKLKDLFPGYWKI